MITLPDSVLIASEDDSFPSLSVFWLSSRNQVSVPVFAEARRHAACSGFTGIAQLNDPALTASRSHINHEWE